MSTAAVTDRILQIPCAGQSMLGILSMPEQAANIASTAVLVIVGGPQYRVGSHRQFVQLARHLASKGFAVLRFDYRGMGDSEGEQRNFESIDADIGAAVDAFIAHGAGVIKDVVLWGLCDGASAALMYVNASKDARIKGLFLMNPWVRSEQTLNETRVKHYYRQRLMEAEFWRKLLRGGLRPSALLDFLRSAAQLIRSRQRAPVAEPMNLSFQAKMLAGLQQFAHPVCLVLSGRDLTAQEFEIQANSDPAWQRAISSSHFSHTKFTRADHTFSDSASRTELLKKTSHWLSNLSSK